MLIITRAGEEPTAKQWLDALWWDIQTHLGWAERHDDEEHYVKWQNVHAAWCSLYCAWCITN